MLVRLSKGEECDRERKRGLTIAEVKEHAKLLQDRTTNRHNALVFAGSVCRVLMIVVAALLTLAPVALISAHVYFTGSLPAIPMCAVVILAASITLLVLAVMRRNMDSVLLSQARRIEPLRVVISDMLESPDIKQLRKRVDAHLHKGNLHAAFELNRPTTWSFSRQSLSIATIAFCLGSACAAAYHFDVTGSVRKLRTLGGGGTLDAYIRSNSKSVNVISAFALAMSIPIAAVAWNDLV
jgi:hypothetical protein